MKLYDTFLFFNELELLEVRLNVLNEVVDYFVISEAKETFSGQSKPLYYLDNKHLFEKFEHKIIHNVIDKQPNNLLEFMSFTPYYTSPNQSYDHKSGGVPLSNLSSDFQREVYQRDSIINGVLDVIKPDDLVLLSDLDEIPCPDAIIKALPSLTDDIYTFCQGWYMYYFNVMSDKEWFGSRLMKFSQLQGNSFDLMRHHLEDRHLQPGPIIENGGWHFSFLGGEKRVLEKLQAYSYQGRKSRYLLKFLDKFFSNRIGRKIKNNEDIFNTGREFETVVLNDRFPSYLIDNRNKYEALIKHDIC